MKENFEIFVDTEYMTTALCTLVRAMQGVTGEESLEYQLKKLGKENGLSDAESALQWLNTHFDNLQNMLYSAVALASVLEDAFS